MTDPLGSAQAAGRGTKQKSDSADLAPSAQPVCACPPEGKGRIVRDLTSSGESVVRESLNSSGCLLRLLTAADVPQAMELSSSAGWNQLPDDWEALLSLEPDGCWAIECAGRIAATATLLCFGTQLAWIGMVLTRPEFRRRGFARLLLEHLLERARTLGLASVKLDATEQGQNLYESLGFRAEQPVERWSLSAYRASGETGREREPAAFTGHLARLDLEAFGVDRSRMLANLARRSGLISNSAGYLFTRAGRLATYLGPCVAENDSSAHALLERSLGDLQIAGCFWDLLPSNSSALSLAEELGFSRQRQLLRMVWGAPVEAQRTRIRATRQERNSPVLRVARSTPRPSCAGSSKANEARIYAIAGFELG